MTTTLTTPTDEAHAVLHGTFVLDIDSRTWCMLGRNGFTNIDGTWWYGSPRDGLTLEVESIATTVALDQWAARNHFAPVTVPDLCPPHGMPRPTRRGFDRAHR